MGLLVTIVNLTSKAKKDLNKIPDYIQIKFYSWAKDVEEFGLAEIRKIPGFHDEPLRGKRKGQRSIRLSKAYRAIYEVVDGEPQIVEVQEVNKHKY